MEDENEVAAKTRTREGGKWDRPPDDLRKGKFEANLYHLMAVSTFHRSSRSGGATFISVKGLLFIV